MLAIWVKLRIKPEQRQRFLQAIEVDALGSERDEAGCLRFNVLQDAQDQNVYYFYEVYKDEAALEAHRAAPHYAAWRAVADPTPGPCRVGRADRKTDVGVGRRPHAGHPFTAVTVSERRHGGRVPRALDCLPGTIMTNGKSGYWNVWWTLAVLSALV